MVLTPWNFYEITLLALTVWREARGASDDARIAVAYSIKNRVDHPGWWGRDLVQVLTKKWQYSSISAPNDPQLAVWPLATDHLFEECLNLAHLVVTGIANCPLPGIDSYYDDSIPPPPWAKEHPERFVGKIGRLNFYNMDCDIEEPHVDIKESEA